MRIDATDGTQLTVAVHGGFLSITPEGVTVLAEFAELSEEIDVSRARQGARAVPTPRIPRASRRRNGPRRGSEPPARPSRKGWLPAMGETELVAGLLLALCLLLVICLVVRRVRLIRGGGVDVSLRRRPAVAGAGQRLGLAVGRGPLPRRRPGLVPAHQPLARPHGGGGPDGAGDRGPPDPHGGRVRHAAHRGRGAPVPHAGGRAGAGDGPGCADGLPRVAGGHPPGRTGYRQAVPAGLRPAALPPRPVLRRRCSAGLGPPAATGRRRPGSRRGRG